MQGSCPQWNNIAADLQIKHLNLLQEGLAGLIRICFLRAGFKFGRRVHFALRRKMLKPPIARRPTI